MKNYNLDLKIETRSVTEGGKPSYIVRGYATVPEHPYTYKFYKNGVSFKEIFSKKGVENLARKAKSRTIFVDALHELGTLYNTKELLAGIQTRTGVDITTESNTILDMIKHSDIPFAKLVDIGVDEKGVFVDTRLNPSFRDVDVVHQKYFDAVWNSLQDGYLNKFSINFKPTQVSNDVRGGEIIPQIDDVDVFGISYCQGAANDMCDITEVALRSAMELRSEQSEVKRMEEDKLKSENEDLRKQLAEVQKREAEKSEADKRAKEDAKLKDLESQKAEIQKQREELEKQKSEVEARMKAQPTSVVTDESRFRSQTVSEGDKTMKQVLDAAPEVNTPKGGRVHRWGFYNNPATKPNMTGKVGLGELITVQGQINSQGLYADDTRQFLRPQKQDIVVRSPDRA